jgi:formylglycine-generating enzyme required for sulfatase activity
MKIVLKPLIAATAVRAMLAVDAVAAKDGWGEEEETTKVVEEDTATSQGSEEPLPVLASNPELPKDRALVKPSVEVSTNTSEAITKTFTITDLSMEMLGVKPGTFEMGSPSPEKDRRDDETPHAVTLTQGFYLGKHEVTQAQWEKVMGSNPSGFKGGDRPVETVSWTDVTSFCDKLTASERAAGRLPAGMTYQLPTEAQWEYACRAGTRSVYSFGENLTSRQANIIGGPRETTSVGKYPANPWGFHDMHGNVWEWCADWYGDFPSGGAVRDPVGPADGSYRVERGGSWIALAHGARCANRRRHGPTFSFGNLGFRLSLRPASK